jgi:electron transport complex protein RnfE
MLKQELSRGIITDNPILVLALGLCPALAISTTVKNGIGMGVAAMCVMICSNLIVSIIKKLIPAKVRIPCYIVIIATFVTIAQLVMKGYLPALDKQLGIFVPLIVVNCMILGRAEAFASRYNPGRSILDGIVVGLGFTIALFILSFIRELLGSNTLWGLKVIPGFKPMTIFILAPGGFLTIGLVMAVKNHIAEGTKRKAS